MCQINIILPARIVTLLELPGSTVHRAVDFDRLLRWHMHKWLAESALPIHAHHSGSFVPTKVHPVPAVVPSVGGMAWPVARCWCSVVGRPRRGRMDAEDCSEYLFHATPTRPRRSAMPTASTVPPSHTHALAPIATHISHSVVVVVVVVLSVTSTAPHCSLGSIWLSSLSSFVPSVT